MSKQLTSDDFKESLNLHVASKGDEIREKYGTDIGWNELVEILNDRTVVRYPSEVVFDNAPLLEGELAHAEPNSENPQDGYKIFVHPFLSLQLSRVPHVVLYQLVRVNYGEFASPDDAETFGATVLGLAKDDYYHLLCAITDEITGGESL
jgi:hypothetical protein